jgi:hypothetical protein
MTYPMIWSGRMGFCGPRAIRVKRKSRAEQLKCKHIWKPRANPVAGWRKVCRKCGLSCR